MEWVVTGELRDSRYRSRTDASLVRAAVTEPSAFSELYARHVEAVYRWFQRRIDWAASDLTAEPVARAWLVRARFRDERNGSALPWLLGIAANVLADTVRRARVETRARERLGLPLDLAADDGYAEVEERLSPRLALERSLGSLPEHERSASSCASSTSFPTRRRRSGWRSARLPRACACPAPSGASHSPLPRRTCE
jgi:DNA-directed RNA polymerase specialized sigma24 family protein